MFAKDGYHNQKDIVEKYKSFKASMQYFKRTRDLLNRTYDQDDLDWDDTYTLTNNAVNSRISAMNDITSRDKGSKD